MDEVQCDVVDFRLLFQIRTQLDGDTSRLGRTCTHYVDLRRIPLYLYGFHTRNEGSPNIVLLLSFRSCGCWCCVGDRVCRPFCGPNYLVSFPRSRGPCRGTSSTVTGPSRLGSILLIRKSTFFRVHLFVLRYFLVTKT